MDRHAATRRLRRLAEAAGVRLPRMHPHMLRHILSALRPCRDSSINGRYRPSLPTQPSPRCRFSDHERTLTHALGAATDEMRHEHHRTRRVRTEATPSLSPLPWRHKGRPNPGSARSCLTRIKYSVRHVQEDQDQASLLRCDLSAVRASRPSHPETGLCQALCEI